MLGGIRLFWNLLRYKRKEKQLFLKCYDDKMIDTGSPDSK